jgi:A/G-specific adenine glycosylase
MSPNPTEGGCGPLSLEGDSPARLDETAREALLTWFASRARDLPWRRERSPYRVWISEVMLQQTRVETVLPYYQRFLEAFPDLRALAAADEDRLMALWAGLGYYSRARNLLRCARRLVEEHGGRFPAEGAALAALPGFGPYTAAAVGSLALGLHLAAVDGNIRRVLARVFALEGELRSGAGAARLAGLAQALLPPGRAGLWNEALMELGATLCRPRRPHCEVCPLASGCRARLEGRCEHLPERTTRRPRPERAVSLLLVEDGAGRLLVRRRGDRGMLRGLWELPSHEVSLGSLSPAAEDLRSGLQAGHRAALAGELGRPIEAGPAAEEFRHEYSHFRARVWPQACRLTADRVAEPAAPPGGWCWLDAEALGRLGFSARDRPLIDAWMAARQAASSSASEP